MSKPILIGFFFAFPFWLAIFANVSRQEPFSGELNLINHEQFGGIVKKANPEVNGSLKGVTNFSQWHTVPSSGIMGFEKCMVHWFCFFTAGVKKRNEISQPGRLLEAGKGAKIIAFGIHNDPPVQGDEGSDNRSKHTAGEMGDFNYVYLILWLMMTIVFVILLRSILIQGKKRKALQHRLNILTAENNYLFNNAPCGYHSIDDNGYFMDMNNTLLKWLGYERHEVLGKLKFTDVIDKKDIPFFEKNISEIEDSFLRMEFNFIKKNGISFPVILSALTWEDEKGGKSLYSTLDNSQCKEALEKIQHLNQELEAFSYSVSHDLRAPLRSIDGYSRILQEDFGDKLDEEGKRVMNVIVGNAKRMGKLIDDLLDFARLGRKDIQRSRINMTGMVNNIVRELVVQEPDRKIDVKVDELDTAFADADMIRQVWLNLIENAIKYTGKTDHAAIEISSYPTGRGELCYKVKDNGVGFDMKYAPKLFGVFQRLHKMQDFSGTGVGLAIVKRIITRHEGRVWAEGTLQEGATFYFTIPIDK